MLSELVHWEWRAGSWEPARLTLYRSCFLLAIRPTATQTEIMSRDFYTLEELARQLGQDRRVVEKQVSRGHIPGRRVGGEWRFNKTEISDWLEHQIQSLSEPDLANLELSLIHISEPTRPY